jgi:hypothetical protein
MWLIAAVVLMGMIGTKLLIWDSIRRMEIYERESPKEVYSLNGQLPQVDTAVGQQEDPLQELLLGKKPRAGFETPTMESWLTSHQPTSPLSEAIFRETQETERLQELRTDVEIAWENPQAADDLGLR